MLIMELIDNLKLLFHLLGVIEFHSSMITMIDIGCSLEDNQDSRHVITANPRHSINRYQSLQQILHHFLVILLFKFLFYNIYDALIIVHIVLPNTITPRQHKLIPLLPLKLPHVRLTRYHLLVIRQRLPLVIKIPKRPSQVQPPVDPSHRYHPSRLLYPLLLNRTVRLVVLR